MTRFPFRFVAALAALVLAGGVAAAQSYPLKIKSVKTGFPHGPNPTNRDEIYCVSAANTSLCSPSGTVCCAPRLIVHFGALKATLPEQSTE